MEDNSLLSQVWAIEPSALQQLASYDRSNVDMAALEARVNPSDIEEKIELIGNGTAVINVHGPIMQNPDIYERVILGMTDSVRLESLVREAAADDSITDIILDIDSPGGAVTGTAEVGNAVRDASGEKSVRSFSRGVMASAAYWIGSQANSVHVTESSVTGSVGVIAPHVDLTGARDKAGIKVTLFTSGKYKASGAYGTSMTEDQIKQRQAEVDAIGENFRSVVTAKRPNVKADSMEGQTFRGTEAVRNGMADNVVSNFAELLTGGRNRGRHAPASADLAVDTTDPVMTTIESTTDGAQDATEQAEAASPEVEVSVVESPASTVAESPAPEAQEPEVAAPVADADEVADPLAEMRNQVEALQSELATMRESFAAQLEERVEVGAAAGAAHIAASAGIDPVAVSNSEVEPKTLADMSEAELWAEYESIEGTKEKRAFYSQHISPNRKR